MTPDFRTLYIFGAGGAGREVAWLSEQLWGESIERIFIVDNEKYLTDPVNGIRVELLASIDPAPDARFVVAMGDPAHRRRCAASCEKMGMTPTILRHPRAEISGRVEIGNGSIICAGCVVTTNVVIGRHVYINVGSTISHDARIGDFATLSPGVHVAGNVHIGENVFIGTGANLINGESGRPLVIGDGAVVAAGACVTSAIEPGAMVAGVPARRKN